MGACFHVVAGGVLLAIARGSRWLRKRSRASTDRSFSRQFFFALLGLSDWPAEIDFECWSIRAPALKSRIVAVDSASSHPAARCGFSARRAPRTHLTTSAKGRPRDSHSRVYRRSAFGAENPQRIRRMR